MLYRSFSDARRALEQGETSCEALVSSFLERIEEENEQVNAIIDVDAEGSLNHARYLDSQLERGNPRPLAGLVLGVKDNICIRGMRTTCGSAMLDQYEAPFDATAIARLRKAGAIFIGKTNCDEFAMGSTNETSHLGPVSHPQNGAYVPGGSSGGSAAAVAAGFCHAALGSDTGGSIRQPTSFCGIVGLKPTYGRVSRNGLVAYASSLDTIGPMASTVEDVARLLGYIAGEDPWDSSSAPIDVPAYTEPLADGVAGVRIGVPREYLEHEALDPAVKNAIQQLVSRLEDEGAEVQSVTLPHTKYGLAAYYVLATAEASSNLARYDGVRYGHRVEERERSTGAVQRALYESTRSEGFGDEVKRRIMLGTLVLSEGFQGKYYEKARQVRALIRHDFDDAFDQADVLIAPVTASAAFEKGSKEAPLDLYESDLFTVCPSLAGIPGLSVPLGAHPNAPNLPMGVQLLGRHFDEALLLQVGDVAAKLAQADVAMAGES